MLRALDIRAAAVAERLLDVVKIIEGKDKTVARPLTCPRQPLWATALVTRFSKLLAMLQNCGRFLTRPAV